MSSLLTAIRNSPAAVRRLFSSAEAPDTVASTMTATISIDPAAADAEGNEADPRAPSSTDRDTDPLDDRHRLNDLEDEVHMYRGLLDDVNQHNHGRPTSCP